MLTLEMASEIVLALRKAGEGRKAAAAFDHFVTFFDIKPTAQVDFAVMCGSLFTADQLRAMSDLADTGDRNV